MRKVLKVPTLSMNVLMYSSLIAPSDSSQSPSTQLYSIPREKKKSVEAIVVYCGSPGHMTRSGLKLYWLWEARRVPGIVPLVAGVCWP